MPDAKVTTVYVQQEQRPGCWEGNAETADRELALSRYAVPRLRVVLPPSGPLLLLHVHRHHLRVGHRGSLR